MDCAIDGRARMKAPLPPPYSAETQQMHDIATGAMSVGIPPHQNGDPAPPNPLFLGAPDRLDRIYAAQRHVAAEMAKNFRGYPSDAAGRVSALCTAIIQEAAELQNKTGWKWWKRPGRFDKEHALDDLAGILHFAIQAAMELGAEPDDLVKEYERVAAANAGRRKGRHWMEDKAPCGPAWRRDHGAANSAPARQ